MIKNPLFYKGFFYFKYYSYICIKLNLKQTKMITIVTKHSSNAYAIYSDSEKIVECNDPEVTYNELVKSLFVNKSQVRIIEFTHFPTYLPFIFQYEQETILQDTIEEETTSLEDVINAVNAKIHAPNLGAYKKNHNVDYEIETYDNTEIEEDVVEGNSNEPVGDVDVPNVGDLIYVEATKGILRVTTGGVATVSTVFKQTLEGTMQVLSEEDEENELEPELIELENIMVETEEMPGVYFNWSELRNKQNDLKKAFGYKPSTVLF